MRKNLFLLAICLFCMGQILQAKDGVIKIVVLGSSTAAGSGPTNPANAWVNQYRQYVKALNSSSEVINLAVGGYTTYQVMPSDYKPVAGRPSPDTEHNITKALSYYPDAIIINLPTNDAASNYTVKEQLDNYKLILAKASAKNVPVFITTTQPRNFSADQIKNLIAVKDSTVKKMGTKSIDFWTGIATAEGTINPIYDIGDGVHLNDAAHTILKNRVTASSVLTHSHAENEKDTINIDFGSTLSTGAWNNLDVAARDTILNMINTKNQRTGVAIWVHDAFTGVNTAGTTKPDASVKFPSSASSDSFFGSVGAHNGVIEATGGVTLSGLDRNSKYSFTIFASRDGITDNRETQYKISGLTEQTVTLDPANNTSKVATVTDIFPAANGTIVVNVGPGPNNSNSLKYYFLGAMRVTSVKQAVVYDADGTINIDFGSKVSSGTWNNLTVAAGGETLSDLVNTEGKSSGISLWVHDVFTGVNETGTTSPDASLGMLSTATSDSFFGSSGLHSGVIEATGGVTLGGLNAASKYSFTFFGSRMDVADNRETQYKVTGKTVETVLLNTANNTKNTVSVANMRPAADGTIKIDVSPGPNNTSTVKYYYLGVIRIDYGLTTGISAELEPERNDELSTLVYPNPFADELTFDCILPESGDLQIKIYNLNGQLVQILGNKNQSEGSFSVKWDGTSSAGEKLKSGLYLCQISLVTPLHVYTNTQKLLVK